MESEFKLFELNVQKVGTIYFPSRVRRAFGCKVNCLTNGSVAVIFSQDLEQGEVISSIEVILANLRLMKRKSQTQKMLEGEIWNLFNEYNMVAKAEDLSRLILTLNETSKEKRGLTKT
ncbi:MAG TPA: hypothetical protein VJ249_03770 [Candidatus Bathyarchaeia archaeon]|nr:hypothetical protein [Candidatus Bathyarchaeia archaeon]